MKCRHHEAPRACCCERAQYRTIVHRGRGRADAADQAAHAAQRALCRPHQISRGRAPARNVLSRRPERVAGGDMPRGRPNEGPKLKLLKKKGWREPIWYIRWSE